MKIKELRQKSTEELQKIYKELCQKKHELTFKVSSNQLKNVREARKNKKSIAQILTLLNESKEK